MTALRILALAGLLGLAACDRGPATITHFMHPSGAFDFLIAATKDEGPLYLEIDGAPFAAADEALAAGITGIMQQALQTRVLRLTPDRTAAEDPRFRLALVFNPPEGGNVLAFCRNQPPGGLPDGAAGGTGRVDLRVGFCRDDEVIAVVDAWVEDAEGLHDNRFQQLIRQTIRDVFARQDNTR